MSKRRRSAAAGLVLAAALIAGLVWQLQTPATEAGPVTLGDPEVAALEALHERDGAARLRSGPSAADPVLPNRSLQQRWAVSSLRGSEPDGALSFDALGRLQADAGLRQLFDYALTLLGEFSLDEIRALLGHWIAERHGAAVADEALAWFSRYLALKQAEATLGGIEDAAERLAQLAALRREHLGAAAEAMFGGEEAYLAHTLERLALLRDPQLDEAARLDALAALDAARDPAERGAEALAQSPALLAQHESQMQTLQADPARRFAERSALWGEEAAQRLAALDAAEADWKRRLADFEQARARLLADTTLDHATREQALTLLLQGRFNEAEQRRVAALQRLALQGGG